MISFNSQPAKAGCFINGVFRMKKKEISKLALLGLTAGILLNTTSIEALETESNTINLDYVLAKPKCKAHGGCGGFTAERNVKHDQYEDEEEDDDTKTNDDSEMDKDI